MSDPATTDAPPAPPGPDPETPPASPHTVGLWAPLLGGPVIWAVHFVAVYLVAEASCASARTDVMTFLGVDALVTAVAAVTLLAAAASAGVGWWAWHLSHGDRPDAAVMGWGGVLLAGLSTIAVLSVGLPILWLEPC